MPFAAVAAANAINIPLMRQRELRNGVPIFDDQNNRLGLSRVSIIQFSSRIWIVMCFCSPKRAAEKGIAQVIFSRVVMATPGMSKPLLISIKMLPYKMSKLIFCCSYSTNHNECSGQERRIQEVALAQCSAANLPSGILVCEFD